MIFTNVIKHFLQVLMIILDQRGNALKMVILEFREKQLLNLIFFYKYLTIIIKIFYIHLIVKRAKFKTFNFFKNNLSSKRV